MRGASKYSRRKGVLRKHPQIGPGMLWISNDIGQPDVRATQLVKDEIAFCRSRSAPLNGYRKLSWISRTERKMKLRTAETTD